ncbi:MAG: DNA polymerase III subunit delta' [Methylotenera sp.]|nr:MAG: DNA polymerase III subunit delta' [Methylotenera sp.]PPD18686.1 MAG: DNA polymerase III subunit delta' [Methylotenera sp.]
MYIWQKNQWQHIMQQRATLPHALLIRGSAGIGKQDFALELARSLLCNVPIETHACGECASCLWFKEMHHPDFRLISPEDAELSEDTPKKKATKKSQISVAQIRQLIDYLSLSQHQASGYRVILISPAETLNIASANALLKMLEEPPANTLFLLVTNQPQRLLATITSRCQAIDMPLPSKQDALSWLKEQNVGNAEAALDYAGGAPLIALQGAAHNDLTNDLIKQLTLGAKLQPFMCAPMLLLLGMERAIDTLQKWIFDLTAYKLSQKSQYHAQHINALQALCKSVNLNLLLNFQQKLVEAKKMANHPLSNEMQLENMLLNYTKIFN